MPLSTPGAFKVKLAKALGLQLRGIIKLMIGDLAAQREKQRRTRRLPRDNSGNPHGNNIPREYQSRCFVVLLVVQGLRRTQLGQTPYGKCAGAWGVGAVRGAAVPGREESAGTRTVAIPLANVPASLSASE